MPVVQDVAYFEYAGGVVIVAPTFRIPTLRPRALSQKWEIRALLGRVCRGPADEKALYYIWHLATGRDSVAGREGLLDRIAGEAAYQRTILVFDSKEQHLVVTPAAWDNQPRMSAYTGPDPGGDPGIGRMGLKDRFAHVVRLCAAKYLTGDAKQELLSFIEGPGLAILVAALAALAAGHAFGVGEAVDVVLIAVGLIFLGWQVFEIAKLMVVVIDKTVNAKSEQDLDTAAQALSKVIVAIGITALLTLLTKGAGKRARSFGDKIRAQRVEAKAAPAPAKPVEPAPSAAAEPSQPSMKQMAESKLTPMSAADAEAMRPRWQAIDKEAAMLKDKGVDFSSNAKLNEIRMGNSGTITGREGTGDLATRNWQRANAQVAEWAAKGEDLSVDKINQLNAMLGDGLAHNGGIPGQLRSMEAAAGSWTKMYYPSEQVPGSMNEFMSWYNANKGGMGPVQLSGESYQRLVSIHPYADANGRTTRLVGDWILQKNGLPPAAIEGAAERNMAVYALYDSGATPTTATQAMTSAVERSLSILKGP